MATTYTLSIEEVSYLMGIIGGAEIAGGFLVSTLGKLSKETLNAKLLAAGHSLVARGVLDIEPGAEAGDILIEQDLRDAVAATLDATHIFRCEIRHGEDPVAFTLFVGASQVTTVAMRAGVTCQLNGYAFAEFPAQLAAQCGLATLQADRQPLATMSGEALLAARGLAGTVPAAELAATLPLPPEIGMRVATTMTLADTVWSSVLRIEAIADERAVANSGVVLMTNNGSGWLFKVDREHTELYEASQAMLIDLLSIPALGSISPA
jgi:hypothetical protein